MTASSALHIHNALFTHLTAKHIEAVRSYSPSRCKLHQGRFLQVCPKPVGDLNLPNFRGANTERYHKAVHDPFRVARSRHGACCGWLKDAAINGVGSGVWGRGKIQGSTPCAVWRAGAAIIATILIL